MPTNTLTLPPVRAPDPSREDRYRAVLQAIATGGPGMGRAMTGVDAQDLARRALVEMGDGWTKRGTPTLGDATETPS